jgi:cytohesin
MNFRCSPALPRCIAVGLALMVLGPSTLAFCGEIHEAVKKGDLTKVMALVKIDPKLVFSRNTSPEDTGATPLYLAALYARQDIVVFLLANRADVNARTDAGATPLFVAASSGGREVAELLLTHGADVNARDDEGETPLFWAARFNGTPVAKLLLAGKADVNARNKFGKTSLHVAADWGREEMAEFLLASKAEVNARDQEGSTPLNLAAASGHVEVVKLLLAGKAEVNTPDEHGKTPLHAAADYGHGEVVKLLLARHAALDARDHDGKTPMQLAKDGGHADVVELLQHGGQVSAATPAVFFDAVNSGELEEVRALLKRNPALVFSKGDGGWTPLHVAAYWDQKGITELLLANKAPLTPGTTTAGRPCTPPPLRGAGTLRNCCWPIKRM